MFDAMEPIGLDTLKATRALQAAGFEAAQAEALVTVFGGPVLGNVATKEDYRDLRAAFRALRTELKEDIEDLRTEFKADIDGLRSEFKADIKGLRTELKTDIGQLRDESAEIRGNIARLSREMGDVRSEVAEIRLQVGENVTKAQMYRSLLVQATVIVGLIVGLQQLF